MKDNTLLVEKYRPTVLQDYVGNENVKETIQKYLDQNYNLGSLSGECVEYHDNGNVRSTGNMKVNLMDGDWIFYYRSGRIEAKCNFAMGTLMKGTNFYDTDEHKVMATF